MLKNMKNRKKKKGFTLIELVIVLAVLAIIALIAIPNFTKVRQDSMIKADQRTGDVIKRVVLTNIADQKLVVGAGGDLTITPVSGAAATVTAGTGLTLSPANATDMAQDLKEVAPPQQKGMTKYVVTIDVDENVTLVKTVA